MQLENIRARVFVYVRTYVRPYISLEYTFRSLPLAEYQSLRNARSPASQTRVLTLNTIPCVASVHANNCQCHIPCIVNDLHILTAPTNAQFYYYVFHS
jgi:hypothetical protein